VVTFSIALERHSAYNVFSRVCGASEQLIHEPSQLRSICWYW
jgi:hypothetical protein